MKVCQPVSSWSTLGIAAPEIVTRGGDRGVPRAGTRHPREPGVDGVDRCVGQSAPSSRSRETTS
jgi:hypothetical protein